MLLLLLSQILQPNQICRSVLSRQLTELVDGLLRLLEAKVGGVGWNRIAAKVVLDTDLARVAAPALDLWGIGRRYRQLGVQVEHA